MNDLELSIIVDIPDHPTTGHKRKVEITELKIDLDTRNVFMITKCVFYENINGEYGDPVSIPMPLEIGRLLTAADSGPRVTYVQFTTGKPVLQKERYVGPVEDKQLEVYYVLRDDETTEVPSEEVTTTYRYLFYIMKEETTNVYNLMAQFVLDEVALGTYDKVEPDSAIN